MIGKEKMGVMVMVVCWRWGWEEMEVEMMVTVVEMGVIMVVVMGGRWRRRDRVVVARVVVEIVRVKIW